MSPVWFIVMLVLVFGVVAVLTSPWRSRGGVGAPPADDHLRAAAADVVDLEASRDAKYREIRDAQLDRQTGKLSDDDFRDVDAGLRSEAVEILRRLDRAQARLAKLRSKEAEDQVTQGIDLESSDSGYHETPS